MPRENTQQIKAQLRQQIVNNISSWKIKKDARGVKMPTNRELERASEEKLREWVQRTSVVANNRIEKINKNLHNQGKRNEIIRPSGLVFRGLIPPQNSGIMFYKNMRKNLKAGQLIKVRVEKENGREEVMDLDDFINFVEGYPDKSYKSIIAIESYSLGMGGGCITKKQTMRDLDINGWIFDVIAPETKNDDCIFACLSATLGIKKAGKTYRKELGLPPTGIISTDELQKISDRYLTNILVYYVYGEKILELDYKCSIDTDKICIVLLNQNHYFLVQRVVRPEFTQLKNKLDHMTKNIVITDECNFERKNEEEFKDFGDIVNYIATNQKHILIHGTAGVGKSVLSRMIKDWYNKNDKELIITSSTGLSALNIGGITIHRYIKMCGDRGIKVDVLIDEIGFLSGNDFYSVVRLLKNDVRLIMVGDLKQLAPVEETAYGYFFESMSYNRINSNLTHIELTKVKRQDNQYTVNIFGKVRDCIYDKEVVKFLKDHKVDRQPNQDEMIISSFRKSVLKYNNDALEKLEESGAQKIEFQRQMQWDMQLIKQAFDNDEQKITQYIGQNVKYLNQQKSPQILYIGEKVLLTENKLDKNLANGSIGYIVGFDGENVIVEFVQKIFNGTESHTKTIQTSIEPVIKYKNGSELYSKKIPLIPAYALTIHKSQGMTISQPLYIDLSGIWCNELIYVAISRVTDENLLSLYNPPIYEWNISKLRKNMRVQQYLDENCFETFAYRMIVEDMDKQMEIITKPTNDILNLNIIYMDYETAFRIREESKLECQQPYHNDIVHFKNKKVVDKQTFQDYIQKENTEFISPNYNGNNVAKQTFDYIMKKVQDYEKEYKQIKKLRDKKAISDIRMKRLKLVTFNGSGFDLYFILTEMLKTERFTQKYEVKQIFKGNSLVMFQLWSLDKDVRQIVLESFDMYQIVNCTLAKALQSYCPDQAEKIKFKNEIIYLAQNRYKNPKILDDSIQRMTSEEYVTIKGENQWKMDNLQQADEWTIEKESIEQLKRISRDPDNINRRYKINIYKNMNLKKSLMEYASNDTEVLPILLESLDKMCHKVFKCSILHFITAGSLCWYGFKQNAPKEMMAEDIYDQNRHKKTRKHGQALLTNLYMNEFEEEKHCLESIIGGKTCPRMKKLPSIKVSDGVWTNTKNTQLQEFIKTLNPDSNLRYVYADISGMYCDLMLNNLYPYGRKWWLNTTEMEMLLKRLKLDITRYTEDKLKTLTEIKKKALELHTKFFPNMFITKVEMQENEISLEPMIAYKQKIGGSDENPMYKTKYTNERRIQTMTSVDIITILLKGGQIYGMEKCLMFEKCGYILRDWMIKCLEIKNDGKKNNLPALTSFGKLLANGTYGQTLKKDKQEVTMFVNQRWEGDWFAKNYKFKNAFITDSDFDILIGTKLIDKKEFITSRCSYIGSFVLAYSRLVIQDICQVFNPEQDPLKQPLVGDTDSLLIREDLVYERLIPNGYMQERSGLLADELADTCKQSFYNPKNTQVFINRRTKKITDKDDPEADPNNNTWNDIINPLNYSFCLVYEGFFVQPKTLTIKYLDIIGDLHYKFRAKGIPLNACWGQDKECMSSKMFVDLLKKSDLNQQQIDELNKQGIKHKITKGEQLECPAGIKVITPNILNGNLNKYGEETKSNDIKIRKNDALYRVVEQQLTRKIFNTEYKGRCISKFDDNIYLPFGHPDSTPQQNNILPIVQYKMTEEEQKIFDEMLF